MKFNAIFVLILMCCTVIPVQGVYANVTVKMTIEPKVFNITYTPGRPLVGNADSQAANFCSKPENQGHRHMITKTVVARPGRKKDLSGN
jgi:hypothetical protein